jgi:transcriptional regulator with XRE-family HTH domain
MFREYLELVGLSGRGLASRAGLSHSTVNHLLTGRRMRCSAGTAYAIEHALNCPPGLLFGPDVPNAARFSPDRPSAGRFDPEEPNTGRSAENV